MNQIRKIILGIVFLFILVFTFFAYYSPMQEKEQDSSNILSETSVSEKYPYLYKENLSFEGYKYCNFVFLPENEDYVYSQRWVYEKFCNFSEGYPNINEFLYNEYFVDIETSDSWQFAAWYIGNGKIILNNQFKRAKNLDIYLAHEIAHSSTENLNLPTWLDEGIAEYSAYRFFRTHFKLNRLWLEDLENWDPNQGSVGDNVRGYTHSGFVIKYYVEMYGDDFIRNLLKEIYGKINSSDTNEVKNKKVLLAFQEVTGNSSLVMEDIICAPSYCVE